MKFFDKNGEEIKSIEDAPKEMRHLFPETKPLVCSKCGRREYGAKLHDDCGMPQPDGSVCKGVLIVP